jgi:hypothetical protein
MSVNTAVLDSYAVLLLAAACNGKRYSYACSENNNAIFISLKRSNVWFETFLCSRI